jgi:hypothetical protein
MAIRKLRDSWQADFMYKGTRYRELFKEAQDAERWELAARAALRNGYQLPEPKRVERAVRAFTIMDEVHHCTDAAESILSAVRSMVSGKAPTDSEVQASIAYARWLLDKVSPPAGLSK